jgi:hypothetical protein
MYCLLVRVEGGPEPNLASYLVTNAVFLVGFFTLAVLLGECDPWGIQVSIDCCLLTRKHIHDRLCLLLVTQQKPRRQMILSRLCWTLCGIPCGTCCANPPAWFPAWNPLHSPGPEGPAPALR